MSEVHFTNRRPIFIFIPSFRYDSIIGLKRKAWEGQTNKYSNQGQLGTSPKARKCQHNESYARVIPNYTPHKSCSLFFLPEGTRVCSSWVHATRKYSLLFLFFVLLMYERVSQNSVQLVIVSFNQDLSCFAYPFLFSYPLSLALLSHTNIRPLHICWRMRWRLTP